MPAFAFSTNAFTHHPLAEAIGAIAALGYSGVEIMADHPHAWPPAMRPRDLREIRGALRRSRLAVTNLNAFTLHAVGDTWNPSWIDPDPRRREVRVAHTRRCLALAEALGAPSISTEPGGPVPPGMSRESALRTFREGLSTLEPEARARGIRILIEPEPGLLIESSGQFAAFFAALDPNIFGLNFDIGHFFCVEEDPLEVFYRLRPAVHHVHLEDIASDRRHRHLIPGTGAMPLAAILQALDDSGFIGFATVELYPYRDRPMVAAAQALAHLRRLTRRPEADHVPRSGS